MPNDDKTYVTFEPGGLITAEAMNAMQSKICADINTQISAALAELTDIANAGDSDKLGGQTTEELLDQFLEKAMQEFPGRTGYRKLFKLLEHDEPKVIEHGLEMCPLVDVYELLPFDVVCAHDKDKHVEKVRLFLYHSSEKKIRGPHGEDEPVTVEIAKRGEPVFRVAMEQKLSVLEVASDDNHSPQDLEEELWKKMFDDPNDEFDSDEYCHSPWYEHCCREERTVGSLKEKGDWDELWLKMMPVKSINTDAVEADGSQPDWRHPTGVFVGHLDLNTVSLRYMQTDDTPETLHVMVLLKV
jgi:hypothetical protein